jgi:Major Facilitator Superfamily
MEASNSAMSGLRALPGAGLQDSPSSSLVAAAAADATPSSPGRGSIFAIPPAISVLESTSDERAATSWQRPARDRRRLPLAEPRHADGAVFIKQTRPSLSPLEPYGRLSDMAYQRWSIRVRRGLAAVLGDGGCLRQGWGRLRRREGHLGGHREALPVSDGPFQAVLRHPVARRLLTVQAISEVGDFVGLSALLLLSYERTGSVLGPAAVFAARTVPALIVGTLFSGWLDRPPRRAALVTLALAGAGLVGVVSAVPAFWVALVVAALLGAHRIAYVSIISGVIAEGVEPQVRRPLFAFMGSVNQTAQVFGILAGASVTLAVGPSAALGFDAVTFVVAAVCLIGLPATTRTVRDRRPPPTEGIRTIRHQPTLWLLAPAVWVSVTGGVLPELLGPKVSHGDWIPVVMAASPAGAALAALVMGRTSLLHTVRNQLRIAAGLGVAFLAGSLVVATGAPVVLLVLANMGVGAGSIWVVGARGFFAQLTPPERMAQVEATMVSTITLLEGGGAFALGLLVTATGPWAAYCAVGALVLARALTSLRRPDLEPVTSDPPPDKVAPPGAGDGPASPNRGHTNTGS